ncbi:hypothetical protein GCM10020220_029820 [Nonomuraea rubra]
MTATAGWVGLVSGTLGAIAVWLANETGLISLPGAGRGLRLGGRGVSHRPRCVSILVSLVTAPKPAADLNGLVYSETPKAQRTDPAAARLPGTGRRPSWRASAWCSSPSST